VDARPLCAEERASKCRLTRRRSTEQRALLVCFGSLPFGIVADEWRVARRRCVDVQLVKVQGDPERESFVERAGAAEMSLCQCIVDCGLGVCARLCVPRAMSFGRMSLRVSSSETVW